MKYPSMLVLLLAACAASDPHSEAAHGRKLMGLQEKFDRFDYDASGDLTRKEIEQGLSETEVTGVSQEEIDGLMEHYDVDGDGAISRWESTRAIDLPIPGHD